MKTSRWLYFIGGVASVLTLVSTFILGAYAGLNFSNELDKAFEDLDFSE